MKLTIDRQFWLRGEGGENSCLLRGTDDKMCCLGCLAVSLGANREEILGNKTPANVWRPPGNNHWTELEAWAWLIKPAQSIPFTTDEGDKLMQINDWRIGEDKEKENEELEIPTSEADREAIIAEMFAQHRVQVEFIN